MNAHLGQAPDELGRGGAFDPAPDAVRTDAVQMAAGVRQTHPETWEQYQIFPVDLTAGVVGGNAIVTSDLHFRAKALIVDNPSSFILYVPSIARFIPANVYGYALLCFPAIQQLAVTIVSGTAGTTPKLTVVATEQVVQAAS